MLIKIGLVYFVFNWQSYNYSGRFSVQTMADRLR